MSVCGEQSSQDTVIIVWTTVQHQLCQEERHNKRRKKEINKSDHKVRGGTLATIKTDPHLRICSRCQ